MSKMLFDTECTFQDDAVEEAQCFFPSFAAADMAIYSGERLKDTATQVEFPSKRDQGDQSQGVPITIGLQTETDTFSSFYEDQARQSALLGRDWDEVSMRSFLRQVEPIVSEALLDNARSTVLDHIELDPDEDQAILPPMSFQVGLCSAPSQQEQKSKVSVIAVLQHQKWLVVG